MIQLLYNAAGADEPKVGPDPGWLLLIHQIPPRPSYFRVKIWRRLERAVAVLDDLYESWKHKRAAP